MKRSRTLVVSTRRTSRLLGSGSIYEFEDAIAGFESADVVEIVTTETSTRLALTQRINSAVRVATGGRWGDSGPIPWPADAVIERDYELCVILSDTLFNMRLLNLIRGARRHAKRVVMIVPEVWPDVFTDRRILTQPYGLVDHFFISHEYSVQPLAEVSRRPVTLYADGVDTKRFEPVIPWAERPVDVCWTGRRIAPMHADLLRLADVHRWLYYYDGFTSGSTDRPTEQRNWLAGLLGRSRFAISHFARVNQPELHRGKRLVASRFFESAAAGCVLVGATPDSPQYRQLCGYPDATIDIALDEPRLGAVLRELATDRARMDAISRRNVAFSLRSNDWGHRWADMLDALGMARPQRLVAHLEDLGRRARGWDPEQASTGPTVTSVVSCATVSDAPSASATLVQQRAVSAEVSP